MHTHLRFTANSLRDACRALDIPYEDPEQHYQPLWTTSLTLESRERASIWMLQDGRVLVEASRNVFRVVHSQLIEYLTDDEFSSLVKKEIIQ